MVNPNATLKGVKEILLLACFQAYITEDAPYCVADAEQTLYLTDTEVSLTKLPNAVEIPIQLDCGPRPHLPINEHEYQHYYPYEHAYEDSYGYEGIYEYKRTYSDSYEGTYKHEHGYEDTYGYEDSYEHGHNGGYIDEKYDHYVDEKYDQYNYMDIDAKILIGDAAIWILPDDDLLGGIGYCLDHEQFTPEQVKDSQVDHFLRTNAPTFENLLKQAKCQTWP